MFACSRRGCHGDFVGSAPLEVITKGTWERALFTTYALSLSFFEAHLLRRGLRQNGCREIWVAADIDGYAQSLAERQALSVGQDYRLIPVALRAGVFHPKCVYLHGADGDVLIVGSGNLTFGGYGRNVEVAEVFHSRSQPEVFTEFAAFLRALKQRAALFCPDCTWMDLFAEHAERVSGSAQSNPAIRLVHCVTTPIDDQLVDAIGEHRSRDLRILSPYYDPDAAAVRRLATRIASRRTIIGLLPSQEERSAFPFGTHSGLVEAAIAQVDAVDRRLHAKWLEVDLEDGRTVTLTGSVNATTQSLCTTNNVEVGVLRIGDAATRFSWQSAPIPKRHVINERKAAGIGSRFMLHVSMPELGLLRGVVLPPTKSHGRWRAVLSQVNGDSVSFSIEVDESGSFENRPDKSEGFDFASGLQLAIERGEDSARAWIQNEWLLELARVRNVPTGSILRFLRGESADEDNLAVLEFLSSCLDDLPSARSQQNTGGNGENERAKNGAVVAVAELAPQPADEVRRLAAQSAKGDNRIAQLLQRLLHRFESDLTATSAPHASADANSEGDEDEEESEDEEQSSDRNATERFEKTIDRFRGFVRERLRTPAGTKRLRELCNVWFVVETLFRARRQDNAEDLRLFFRHWLIESARCCRRDSATEVLDNRVVAVAATLGAIAIAEKRETELVGLHEALENFGVDAAPDAVPCKEACIVALRPATGPDLQTALERVLAARTRRQEARAVYDAVMARKPFSHNVALLATSDGRNLVTMRRSGAAPKVRLLGTAGNHCPVCYKAFPRQFQLGIERLRFAQCVSCETFYFNLDACS